MNRAIKLCVFSSLVTTFALSTPAVAGHFRAAAADAVPGEYVVTLAPSSGHTVRSRGDRATLLDAHARALGGRLVQTFGSVLDGGVVAMGPAEARTLAKDPSVAVVEPNYYFHAAADQVIADPNLWGLDRIDQRRLPGDSRYSYEGYGAGACVYGIDSGIDPYHPEFGGRASVIANLVPNEPPVDFNGHGTQMAGIFGGVTYGVAKSVTIKAVKVLNASGGGTLSGILSGLQVAIDNHALNPEVPCVVHMALNGPYSESMISAVEAVIAAGLLPVVAAGNSYTDACLTTPAATPAAITVGAVTGSDTLAAFSNYGSCVDLLAPGVAIRSAGAGFQPYESLVGDGTSQASAFAAGVAVLLHAENPSATPSQLSDALIGFATPGKITGLDSSTPNRLLYSLDECRGVPQTGCMEPGKASVLLKDSTDDAKDLLKWVWKSSDVVPLAALAEPSSTTTYSLCVYDDIGTIPAEEASLFVGPGSTWTSLGDKGWRYADKTASTDGVTKISLKPGDAGKASVNVLAKGLALPLPAPLGDGKFFWVEPSVTVQLQSNTGECWSSSFDVEVTKKNVEGMFKAALP